MVIPAGLVKKRPILEKEGNEEYPLGRKKTRTVPMYGKMEQHLLTLEGHYGCTSPKGKILLGKLGIWGG